MSLSWWDRVAWGFFVTCEAGSDAHSEDDVDGQATGSSGSSGGLSDHYQIGIFVMCGIFLHSCLRQLGEISVGWKIRLFVAVGD